MSTPILTGARCSRCFTDKDVSVDFAGETRCAPCQRYDPRCAYCFGLLGPEHVIVNGTRYCSALCQEKGGQVDRTLRREARRHNQAVSNKRHRRFSS